MFEGDPDFDSNQIIVTGVEAFGIFSIWTGQHGVATLDIGTMSLTCHRLAKPDLGGPALPPLKRKPLNDPHNEARGLIPFEPEWIDFWDPMNVAQFGKTV